jgi:S-formylglutathione hydrolase FrmB
MRTFSTTVWLCWVTALPLAAQSIGGPSPEEKESRGKSALHGTFGTDDFEAGALGGKASHYGVYLPEGYDRPENADRRYPLVIWLHGLFEDHRRFADRGGIEIVDRMIAEGRLPPLVLVTAKADRSFYINGAGGGQWEDLITTDLLEHVQSTYRVSEDRGQRALMGVSMGGYGALKIAFKHPELFGVVAAHSAAILPRDPDQLDEAFPRLKEWGGAQAILRQLFGEPLDRTKWKQENLLLIADRLEAKSLDGLRVYLDCGDHDRYGFDAPNTELHEILKERGIEHSWRLVAGGNHGWQSNYNREELPHSLEFVAAVWAKPASAGAAPGAHGKGRADRSRG